MQTAAIDWLVADFSIFGLRLQHWMPIVAAVLAIFVLVNLLDRRTARK